MQNKQFIKIIQCAAVLSILLALFFAWRFLRPAEQALPPPTLSDEEQRKILSELRQNGTSTASVQEQATLNTLSALRTSTTSAAQKKPDPTINPDEQKNILKALRN